MIDTRALAGEITRNGYNQKEVAEMIGITPNTFYNKMKKGVFGSDEIEIMIKRLRIRNPWDIFFPTCKL